MSYIDQRGFGKNNFSGGQSFARRKLLTVEKRVMFDIVGEGVTKTHLEKDLVGLPMPRI